MIGAVRPSGAAAPAQARSRDGAWARAQCAQACAAAPSGGGRRKAARRGVRPDVSQPGRARSRLRQACRSDRPAAAAGLRLCRGGRRHAEAAAGQSATAAVPARPGRGHHQPLRLQQRWRRGGRAAARGARGRSRHRRDQSRLQQGYGRPRRGLRDLHRGARAACGLSHRQHFLAQHRGLAQPATGERTR